MKPFTQYPFFRIIVPFAIGICIALSFGWSSQWLPALSALLAVALFLQLRAISSARTRIAVMVTADCFFLLLGLSVVDLRDVRHDAAFFGRFVAEDSLVTVVAEIADVPVKTARSTRIPVNILHVQGLDRPVTAKALLYVRGGASDLLEGSTIVVHARFSPVPPPSNPFEFDYRRYLAFRQVHYSAFVDSSGVLQTSIAPVMNPVWRAGLRCKRFVMTSLKTSGLTPEAYAITTALLTGYDDDISRDTMQAFAHSGTLHVLSVSGLHTGLIYLVLNFLFDRVDRRRRWKIARLIIITIGLWSFALITGFSAPVLRAVIMFNLMGTGRVFFRAGSRHQLNVLAVSAFILLFYDPFLIADVGFQLSYMAMFGLLFYQPRFSRLWQPSSPVARYTWQSVTASFAATLSTLPLTLYYFKQFPLWFALANLVVVPATFVLLLLGAAVVAGIHWLVPVMNWLVDKLGAFIRLFGTPGTGYIDSIHFYAADLVLLSLIILVLTVAIDRRNFGHLRTAVVLLLLWQLVGLYDYRITGLSRQLTVYNVRNGSARSLVTGRENVVFDPEPAKSAYNITGHLNHMHGQVVRRAFNQVAGNTGITAFVEGDAWPVLEESRVTTLVFSRLAPQASPDLSRFRSLRNVVADASCSFAAVRRLDELCRKFAVAFHDTRLEGAYQEEL